MAARSGRGKKTLRIVRQGEIPPKAETPAHDIPTATKKMGKKPPRSGRSGVALGQLEEYSNLIPHRLVADKLGVTPDALRDWVIAGMFPEPHSVIERTWLYPVDDFRFFLENGRWPDGTKFRGIH